MFSKLKQVKEFKKKQNEPSEQEKTLQELKRDMSAQYALNKPSQEKVNFINVLRRDLLQEEIGIQEQFSKQLVDLHVRYMRDEIKILKNTL